MASRTSSLDEMISDALARVNIIRRQFGFPELNELPDARQGDTKDCLFYRGLKDVGCTGVGANSMTFQSERQAESVAALWGVPVNGKNVTSPSDITRVIGAFDRGDTPHYNV